MNDKILKSNKSQMPIIQLVLPMFIENIIRTSLMSVDQLMLYYYSEKAVAALGVVNQMAFFIQLIYMMIAIGASIHISQNLGADNVEEAGMVCLASYVLITIMAVLLSLFFLFFTSPILKLFPLENEVNLYAWQFLIIYAGGSIFMALNILQSAILRSYGYSHDPMVINIIALIFTILGNSLCLFGFFGFPILGVPGVAVVTVLSQFISLWIMSFRIKLNKDINIPYKNIFKIPSSVYIKILSVGVPTAGENLSYNFGQIVISRMIAGFGTNTLAAYSLVITLSRYVYISGISIGSGTQIKVGYFIGADKIKEAHRKVYKYFITGLSVTVIIVVLLNIFKYPIIGLFTSNKEIISIASSVLLVSLILEPGRSFNTIIIPGLKGAGDIHFPVFMGMIFMWGVGVFGAYLLGIYFNFGLIGIWIAISADEWTRGIIMLLRWRSGKWQNKSLVTK